MESDLQDGLDSGKESVSKLAPIAPKAPPMAPPRIGPPPTTSTPRTSSGGLDADIFKRALLKRKAPRREKTLDEELIELNEALSSAGKQYRVPDVPGLKAAKSAAGMGNIKQVAVNFRLLKTQLVRALELGAFDDIDGDEAAKREYARLFQVALLGKSDEIGRRRLPDSTRLADYTITFDDCILWADRVTERPVYTITEANLAELIFARLGGGSLGGVFPGEAVQQSVVALTRLPEKAMRERILADREHIMGAFGRAVAQELAHAFPGDKPELTGSILAPSVELSRVPEDVDVNISTSGTATERTEEFLDNVGAIDQTTFTITLTDIGQAVTIFPKMATKIDGRIAELFYAYSLNYIHHNKKLDFEDSEDVLGTLVPVDLEIKDVGGEEWTTHLKDGGEERTTNPDKTTKGRWLLADILNRIHAFRELMRERLETPDNEQDEIARLEGSAKTERWYEIVTEAVTEESERKKLFEKLHVFGNMAMLEFGPDSELQVVEWLEDNISGKLIDDFTELFVIGCSKDKSRYTEWILDPG